MIAMLSIENFSLHIQGKTLLKETHLIVAHNHKYALVGKNGTGKTTLLHDIKERVVDTSCYLVSQDITSGDDSVYNTILRTHTQLWELKMLLENYDITTDEELSKYNAATELWDSKGYSKIEKLLYRILHGLGFTDTNQSINSFSGGWRMRIALASALFIEPELLLLDEPTNHLDLNGTIWLVDYLSSWKNTLIIVSHDTEFLNSVCTDTIHIWNQKLTYYSCSYDKYLTAFQKDQQVMLAKWDKYQKALKTFKSTKHTKDQLTAFMKKYEVPEPLYEKIPKLTLPPVSDIGLPVLEMCAVSFGYKDRQLLNNVDLGIDLHSRYTIVGANGVGKSTIMKLLAGDLVPQSGIINRNRHLRVGYYHQHSSDVLPDDDTPVSYLTQINNTEEQTARRWLGQIGLLGKLHIQPIKNLSGGQKARVALVGTLLNNPHVLLLDEPTNHLDIETIHVLIKAINSYTGAIICITHNLELIEKTHSLLLHIVDQSVTQIEDYTEYRDLVLDKLQ